ncbi:glycosyltransferase 87 family protein [Kribbella solani]|uniref:Alpha-1,2-mannosyltransferase n=1 Tax=Kribbella solani TaxID=236067 RepID=A0A841DG08_9ACTN|nr:alpha-1,2-mannosyltransferase [Kribbella solani]
MLKGGSGRQWAMAAVVLVALGVLLPFGWDHTGADLKVYRVGGLALLQDPLHLYDVHPVGISLPFTYPVFAAVVMIPAALLPWAVTYGASIAVSLVALAMIWAIGLRSFPVRPKFAVLLALFAASILLEPVRETLSYGQINLILCALILYDALDLKHRGRGIGIGIAAGIKLTPLVFLGFLLVTKQYKMFARASAAFAGTVALGFLITPDTSWRYWTSLITDTGRIGALAYTGNQSWNGFLVRLTGDPAGGGPIWLAVAVLTGLAGLYLARTLWLAGQRLAAVSVTGLISLLCSPVSWSHHWVWMLPMGIALVSAVHGRRRVIVGAAWYAAFALAPIWWPPYSGDHEYDWNFWQQIPGNSYIWLGLGAAVFLWFGVRRDRLANAEVPKTISGTGRGDGRRASNHSLYTE